MIYFGNYKCNCLVHGDLWITHEAIRQLNHAPSPSIHLHGKQRGAIVPRFHVKRPAVHFGLLSPKEQLHSVPPFTPSRHRDGEEIPKCCRSEPSEPLLDGPENGSCIRMDNILGVFDEDQDFNGRYQTVEEPWLPLPSVLSSFAAEDMVTVGSLMDNDKTADAVELDSLSSKPLLSDANSFFKNDKMAFASNTILESGKNFSGTDQLVEEPWLLYPAIESVNTDVGSSYQAFTREESPEVEQDLTGHQEISLQVPEKVLAKAESKRLLPNDSISTEILINCSICSMQRIAVLEDGELVELLLDPVKDDALCGSVYLGVVKKLVPQMGGALVDIGNKPSLMHIQQSKQPFIFPPFRSTTRGKDTHGVPRIMIRELLAANQNGRRASDGVEEHDDDAVVDFQDGPTVCINGDFADHEVEDDLDVNELKSRKSIGAEQSTDHLHVDGSCLNYEDSRNDISAKYSWSDVQKGTKIIVQVVREGLGRKGPYLTPYPKLTSRFWVLVTRNNNIGISKTITGAERNRLRVIAKTLQPPGFGLIVRTVADGHLMGELRKDLEGLLLTWKSIMEHANSAVLAAEEGVDDAVPVILHQAMGRTLSVVQDYFSNKVKRMVVDSPRTYHEVTSYLQEIGPDLCDRVELHDKKVPLFHEFNLEKEINNLLNKRVALPDGGSLVIEQTEALVSIDVNGGHKMLGDGSSPEKAVLDVNLAAAKQVVQHLNIVSTMVDQHANASIGLAEVEANRTDDSICGYQIARELRLRDIGGIIVVDFIDMQDDCK
ncbi:hypothetical protein Dimus_017025 [Dionaea muscipula]